VLLASLIFIVALLWPLLNEFGIYIHWVANSFGDMSALYLWVALFIFGLSLICLAMVLSTVFTDGKLASQLGPVIIFFPTSIALLLAIEASLPLGHEAEARTVLQCLYFLPWFPFEVIVLETIYNGGVKVFLKLDVEYAWIALCLQPIVYFILYLYLDEVIPNAFGISKSCFYCLRCRRPPPAAKDPAIEEDADPINKSNLSDGMSDGAKEFDASDPIQIQGLTKKFGRFTAVDKMTVSIKGNEVFTILGHNGAGKTTAIYMLTGMLQATSGDAVLYNNSVS
jgi:ABC-type multidrug transport system fused ATPase/permease subunit